MKKQWADQLNCSFCGRQQREVKKLIAGPQVFICDECIGLCNDIIAEEVARQAGKEPETIRLKIGPLLEDEATATDELSASIWSATEVPESVWTATWSLVAASKALRTAVQRWSLLPEESAAIADTPAWLEPVLSSLTQTEELAHGLRRALERSLAPERMNSFDRLLGHLSSLRKTLMLNARNEEAGRRAASSGKAPVD